MDLAFNMDSGKVLIKNTYTFTTIDKNGNEVDKKTYYNVCMPKRYFANNLTNLTLCLGTMLAQDYAKYQKNGVWDREYCSKTGTSGSVPPTASETPKVDDRRMETQTYQTADGPVDKVVDAGPVWKFKGKVKNTDTGLFGTTAYSIRFNWKCTSISTGSVVFRGSEILDYHSYASKLNKNVKPDEEGASNVGTVVTTDSGSYVIVSEGKSRIHFTNGIHFEDGGLFGSDGTCVSHFLTPNLCKRPFEKMQVDITISFSNINCYGFGTPFIPQGNIMYGHNTGDLCHLRPNNFRFGGMPIRQCSGASGCVPIMGAISMSLSNSVATDKPNDWDDKKDGIWYGAPFYNYFGNGYPYITKEKKQKVTKNGVTTTEKVTVDSLNLKGQRQFSFKNIKESKISNFNFGPIRSIVLEGCAAANAVGLIKPPSEVIRGFLIGVGDGRTKCFAHAITTEIGKIDRAYTDNTGGSLEADRVTYYSQGCNVFSSNFIKMYDGRQTIDVKANTFDSRYYDKDNRKVSFGLHPFTLDYYIGRSGLLGVSEWLIYQGTNGSTIKSYWVGMNEGRSIFSDVEIVTADDESELYSQLGSLWGMSRLSASAVQHEYTVLNEPIQLKKFTAVKGGNGWTTLSCYCGGFRYGFYDVSGIRICSTDKVPGFIEFNEPPRQGAKIYIDVKFNMPFFINDMMSLSGRAYCTFGDASFNGKDKQ